MVSKMRWMMLAEQLTIPEGMVNGPDRLLPKNSVFNGWETLSDDEFRGAILMPAATKRTADTGFTRMIGF